MNLPSKIKGWFNPQIQPEQLLERFARTNNQKYLSALIAHYNQALFHYLLSQSDHATAQDVLQTSWLKVIEGIHLYRFGTSSNYWLFAIARNSLIDELRKQQRWQLQEITDSELQTSSLFEQLDAQDQSTRFDLAIAKLPFHQREAFIFQQEGFSLKQIAELTDENQQTVKSKLRYARKTLKRYLETNR